MIGKGKRVKKWAFTLFPPSNTDAQRVRNLLLERLQPKANYIIMGIETCPTTTKKHI